MLYAIHKSSTALCSGKPILHLPICSCSPREFKFFTSKLNMTVANIPDISILFHSSQLFISNYISIHATSIPYTLATLPFAVSHFPTSLFDRLYPPETSQNLLFLSTTQLSTTTLRPPSIHNAPLPLPRRHSNDRPATQTHLMPTRSARSRRRSSAASTHSSSAHPAFPR